VEAACRAGAVTGRASIIMLLGLISPPPSRRFQTKVLKRAHLHAFFSCLSDYLNNAMWKNHTQVMVSELQHVR
jgi:hypothetical protein